MNLVKFEPADRYWFLTWTTYGTWLPGDTRGFVSNAWDGSNSWPRNNRPGTPSDRDIPLLAHMARQNLAGPPIRLTQSQADELLVQFTETANCRRWQLLAVAIMANHCHIVLGVPGDPEPAQLLRDLKSYGSRRLNLRFGKPRAETWWTESGSRRKLPTHESVLAAIKYVLDQHYALVIWTAPIPELNLIGGRRPDLEGRIPIS